jgi:putative peptidoglycan lipid II flippase
MAVPRPAAKSFPKPEEPNSSTGTMDILAIALAEDSSGAPTLEQTPVPSPPAPEPPVSGTAPGSGIGTDSGTGRAKGGLLRATALMASGSLVSRLLGFVRSFLFGAVFVGIGSSVGSAFSAANVMPNTIWIMIGGGTLNAILVPAIVRATRQPDRGSDFTSRLFTLVTLAAAALTVVSMLAVPALMVLTNGNLPPATYALAVTLGYWLMPQMLFSALYVMCGQLLNAHDSFGPYQWAPVFNNLVGIVGAVVFLATWGAQGDPTQWTLPMIVFFAAINVGGTIAEVIFLSFYVRKLGLKLRPKWGFRGLGLGKLGRIGLWTLAMVGLGQVGLWAGRWAVGGAVEAAEQHKDDSTLAASFPGLATMDYAYMVFMIPQGILAVSLVTAAFPAISRSAVDGQHDDAIARYTAANRQLAVPMTLCTVLVIALAGPIMWVIDKGARPEGAQNAGWVLVGYMIGLVPFAASYLTKRVFYAYEQAKAPFLIQIPVTLAPLVAVVPIMVLAEPLWAAAAAAAAAAVGNILGFLYGQFLLTRLAHRRGTRLEPVGATLGLLIRLGVAGVASLAVGLLLQIPLGDLLWMNRLLTVVLGLVIGIAWVLRVQEMRSMVRLVTSRLSRLVHR